MRSRSVIAAAFSIVHCRNRAANVSLWYRTIRSPARNRSCQAWPVRFSRLSPPAWPRIRLYALKPSRSSVATQKRLPSRVARMISRCSSSSHARRLPMPATWSVRESRVSSSFRARTSRINRRMVTAAAASSPRSSSHGVRPMRDCIPTPLGGLLANSTVSPLTATLAIASKASMPRRNCDARSHSAMASASEPAAVPSIATLTISREGGAAREDMANVAAIPLRHATQRATSSVRGRAAAAGEASQSRSAAGSR